VQQLLTDQLQELRMASQFSDVPMCEWINQDGCQIPVVACNNWVMPKDCFIMLWFWLSCDGRVYHKLWDDHAWSPILRELNVHNKVPAQYESRMLEYIYMMLYARMSVWEPDAKHANFARILTELAEEEQV
jgi:uncharacterized membrane protein YbaN (DUF454 family)